jgi:DNA/RNA endonuclease YhcR with UshA esterase domain
VTATPGHAIKGNISVAPGAVLKFAPAAASTINLNGTVAQTITNSGTLSFSKNQTIVLNNSNGLTLNGNATFDGALTFTAGKLTIPTGLLALDTAVVTGIGSGKFIDGKVSRLITRANSFGWPAGQNADYLSDSVYASSVPTKGGSLTLQTLDNTVTPFAETARGTVQILKRYVHNSVDTLNFTADSIGISYATADLPAGVYASNLQVVRWNGGPWLNAAVSRIDSTNKIIYVKSNLGVGDYVVTGPAGFPVLSKNSINYGTVPAGQSKKDSVVINNTGNAIMSIDSVTSTLADFTISPSTLPVPIGGPVTFYITYAPTTGGTKNATIVFYHKGINGRDSVSVTGGASLITLFAATPDSLDFGTRIRNSSKTDTIVVANAGNVSLKIDSVRSPDAAFTIAPTTVVNIAGGNNAKFFITYKPNVGGPDSTKIVFYSNSSTEPDTVYVRGNVVIAPIFSASKTSVNFPAVLLGTHKMDSVTVTNTGTAALNITSVTWTDTNYVVTPTSATIAIDAAQKFYVTFSPKVAGTRNTSIVMTSNVTEIHDTVKVYGLGTNVATIAEARKDLNGDLIPDHSVTKDTLLINGVITSKNLQSVGGQTAIFIQDSTGGVEIFGYSLPPVPMVIGDSVFAIGVVYQYHGGTEFEPLTPTPDLLDTLHFGILKHNAVVPKPKHLTLHQLASNGESYEGLLVEIDTLYKASGTWPAVSTGAAIYVTNASKADTSELYISSSTDIGGSVEPSYPINVVAIINQYSSGTTLNNGYEIEPSDSLNITHTKFAALVKISEARKDLNNDLIADHSVTKDTLEVSGVITSTNLQSLGSQTAIFIQDSTAGIEIFNYSLPPVTMVIGDSVFVIGTVSQYRGAVEFTPLANDTLHFGILKHKATVPKAKHLTLHQFVTNAESYEGLLVEIDTLYKASGTWPGAATGAAIYVTNPSKADTAELYISSSTDIGGSVEKAYPINVTAVINQYSSASTVYNNGYEIEPSDTSNIVHQVVTRVDEAFSGIPTSFVLENNYPNPFNPTTTILYGIVAQSHVTVKVYSVLGQEIATLVNDVQSPSYYRVMWNGTNASGNMVSSGVYFYRITAAPVDGKSAPFSQVKKMLLMK